MLLCACRAVLGAAGGATLQQVQELEAAGLGSSSWLRKAVELAPKLREEFHDEGNEELIQSVVNPTGLSANAPRNERLVLPSHSTGSDGLAPGSRRRRLTTEAPIQCPTTGGGSSSYSSLTLDSGTAGTNAISLWNEEAGYASDLFCQWTIAPTTNSLGEAAVVQEISLIFEKFDVPVGLDVLRIFQLKCVVDEAGACVRRVRQELLQGGFPTDFSDAGKLPPNVHAAEAGFQVQVQVRFSSKYATGAAGFLASYTTSDFDLVDATPILMPERGGTSFFLRGAGFWPTSMQCQFAGGGSSDLVVITAYSPDDDDGATNSTIECTLDLGDTTDHSIIQVDRFNEVPPKLSTGTYGLKAIKGVAESGSAATVYVYAPPIFSNVTPAYAAYGTNCTMTLETLEPWAAAMLGSETDVSAFENLKLRFVTTGISGFIVDVALDVPAEITNAASGELPLQFAFDVPMPLVGGDLLGAPSQVQVSLNGQQYEDTNSFFSFHAYCSGRKTLNETEGEFYDHPVERFTTGPPRPYSFCSWYIAAEPADFGDEVSDDDITIALQMQTGSQLLNVGFDYITVYDGASSAFPVLLRWPQSIAEAATAPATVESSSNALLVEFHTGDHSGDASVYQGFWAKYVATAAGRMSLLTLFPLAAPSNSSGLLSIFVSISADLLGEIRAASGGQGYQCLFTSEQEATVTCEEGQITGVEGVDWTEATLAADDNNTFTCPLPVWVLQDADVETVKVSLRGAVEELPCATNGGSTAVLDLLVFGTPELNQLSPNAGAVGTRVVMSGSGMLDPNDETYADSGVVSVCRFGGTQEVTAEWIDTTTIACDAPTPTQPGPNPMVDVEVSNNGYDWSEPLKFTYETYCGNTISLTQSVGSFSDHGGGGTYTLPNSYCDFLIEPRDADTNEYEPGGVELTFDNLDIGPADTVLVYRTGANGLYELIMDAGAYYSEYNTLPPSSELKSACPDGAAACHGLPVKVEFRTGVVTATTGISVSYVTLEAFESGGTTIYCSIPTLSCPTVTTNFGFSSSESTQTASMLQLADSEVSGSVQVAGMVMHYLEVDANPNPAANIAQADDYRIIEIELRLENAGSAASLVIVRQDNYTNSTEPRVDESNQCADTTSGQALQECPSGDYATDQTVYRATSTVSGGTIRLVYCLKPKDVAAVGADERVRLVVGVYGVDGGAGTDVVPYYIQYHELQMQEVTGATLTSLDSSFVSGGGSNGGIGYARISTKFIPKLTATLTSTTGRLLLRALECPTETVYDYGVVPVNGVFGLSIAECEGTDRSCTITSDATSDDGTEQQLWFLGLYSDAGVDASNTSLIAEVAIEGLSEHGASALCAIEDEFTDYSCGGGGEACTHLLTPNQTHHFILKDVNPDQVIKVDACITSDPSGVDGDSCLGVDDGLLAVAIAPVQDGLCLSADSVGSFPDALLVDGANGDSGLAQGHYRLSKCTVGLGTGDWLVSVTSRAAADSSFLPYKLVMYYQNSPSIQAGQITDSAYAGDWNFYFVTVSDANELSLILELTLDELNFDNTNSDQAALGLYLSEAGCPSDVPAENRTTVLKPIRDYVDGTQRYYVTQTPWPGDCNGDASSSGTRLVYIGIYGASASLLRPEGSTFSLALGEGTLSLIPDTPRAVAVQAGQYVVLQVEVSTQLTFNVNVDVLEASDEVTTDALEVHLMPKFDRDVDQSCGWPVLQARLNGAEGVFAGAAAEKAGQSALPLTLKLGTIDAAGTLNLDISVVENIYCAVSDQDSNTYADYSDDDGGGVVADSVETWYVALKVPDVGTSLVYAEVTISQSAKEFEASDAKEGAVLSGQWAHFQLETSTEGTISLNVDIDCFGDCQAGLGIDNDGNSWLDSLLLVAQQDGDGSCPYEEATTKSAGGNYLGQAENKVRFSVNLCTGSGGVYRVGLLGQRGYGIDWNGGALSWSITSESVEQKNLATYSEGQSLDVTLGSGQWQYHYFELPDPTCADSDSCLEAIGSTADAEACRTGTDVDCKTANALFPANIDLQVSPIGGADIANAAFYVVIGDCGVAIADWLNPPVVNNKYTVTYDSVKLIDEYIYAQLSAIIAKTSEDRDDGLAACAIAEVISCAQCAKRSPTGECEDTRCCFTPKIYVAFEGLTTITDDASYELTPTLSCTAGYRAAGGTYASACEPCPEGTFSTGGQAVCTFTRAGYFSIGGQDSETPCAPGSYSSAVGQSACLDCALGTAQDAQGQKSCEPCEAGLFSPVMGAITCQACPDTFTSREGSIYRSECFCRPDFYKKDMQNAALDDDLCLPCPDNAICRGGCPKNPSANDCSEKIAIMEGVTGEQLSKFMGGLTWIPIAMPYPTAGYYQPLDADFVSPDDAPPADCERTGPGACWWPLLYEDGVFVSCSSCRLETQTMKHNNIDWQLPWWSHDPQLSYSDAALNYAQSAAPFAAGQFDSSVGRSLFQCQQGSWTYDDTPEVGCTTCLAQLYYTKGSTCAGCNQQLSAGIIILGIFLAICVGALLVVASKVGFNWAAISISINFLQVSAIFANFSIEWPPEVLALLDLFNFFVIDVEVIQAECNFRISYFEKWISMVLLPFILFAFLASAGLVLSFISFIMSRTRFPVWVKRKLWRQLKPPSLVDSFDPDEELVDKVARKLKNLRRKLLYLTLSLSTKPIPRQRLEALQDTIFNAFVTLLSVYYMTGCKRSLEIFRCVKRDPELILRASCPPWKDATPEEAATSTDTKLMLIYKKMTLEASEGSGEVICGQFNYTRCEYDVPKGPMTQEMLTTFTFGRIPPFESPNHKALMYIAAFFVTLYAVCIPLFFFIQLQRGKHKLNHLNFGRRYGYLYKRYEVEWFWWECTVMVRKLMLSAVDIFAGLDNGGTLPGQQSALGMSVVMVFLMAQAAAMPYVEPHLDALESLLLVVNYTFLFLGLCDYAIGLSSASAPDQSLKFILTISMTTILIIGILFLILFLALDITLQLVRLYFRFVEGEGKYGARQQLVLTDLTKEARRVQALGARLLGSERRQRFQEWLNRKATDDEKVLVKAAFTSLAHYLDTHEDHSMPWYVTSAAKVPLLGGGVTWAYQKQHKFWLRRRAKRIQKARNESLMASSQGAGSDSMRSSISGRISAALLTRTKSDLAARRAAGRTTAVAMEGSTQSSTCGTSFVHEGPWGGSQPAK